MRIMEVTSGGDINGAVVHCLELTRQLTRRGHEVVVVCPPNSWIAAQLPPEQVVYSTLKRRRKLIREVADIARDRGIEVVHTHQSRAHSFGVLLRWLYGLPSVATAHNRRIQLHWALNSRVIGVSDVTTRFHHRFNLVPRRRIETIHNFVDVDGFSRDQQQREAMRAEWGVAPDRLLLGLIGAVKPKKGLMHLIHALPNLVREHPQLAVAVVGGVLDEKFFVAAQEEAARLKVDQHLIWGGQRQDIPRVLSALDIHVVASEEENLPINVLEAMAAQLPIVASRVGGLPECLEDGRSGLLVPPCRPDLLGQALRRVIESESLRKSLGDAARARCCEQFSAESQLPSIERVLRDAAAERRVRAAA